MTALAPTFSSHSATVPATRILVVDDDPAIRAMYEEILSGQGYAVTAVGSRVDALAAIDSEASEVAVLVIDIALPDADGAELAREIAERIGPRPTLYVSGWTDEFWDLFDAPGQWLVMQKPIPVPRLIDAIEWLAGRRTNRPE